MWESEQRFGRLTGCRSTHHDEFAANLFAINPDTGSILTRPGVSPVTVGIGTTKLALLHQQPHRDALDWRWARTQLAWSQASPP